MTTMKAYMQALRERDGFDINSEEWKAAQLKVEQVVEVGLSQGDRMIALEVQDSIYEMLEAGRALDDEEVEKMLNLLEIYAFEYLAEEIRGEYI